MALSQTWESSYDTCKILANGQSFQTTKNLEGARSVEYMDMKQSEPATGCG